ncbi:hypothetical protein AMEX_G24006 [Astyanax mexicanus]|uniref:Uncharacterized protein n=1 Tax=Astyanax mexicanus TaxID=7994 RepID=A0A8T2KZQ7_ASTMX|nr:hypothetical protein AMEX_G24006 [Astyanax mexicanus]
MFTASQDLRANCPMNPSIKRTEDFFKTCIDANEEETISSIATGILIVERDEGGHNPNSLCLNPLSVGIILVFFHLHS